MMYKQQQKSRWGGRTNRQPVICPKRKTKKNRGFSFLCISLSLSLSLRRQRKTMDGFFTRNSQASMEAPDDERKGGLQTSSGSRIIFKPPPVPMKSSLGISFSFSSLFLFLCLCLSPSVSLCLCYASNVEVIDLTRNTDKNYIHTYR